MNFEDLQKTWQAQAPDAKMMISTDILLREVRRNQRQFQAQILRRDVVEVAVCGLMAISFGVWGVLWGWWSLILLALCCLFVGGFFVADRRKQSGRQPAQSDTLRACAEKSLHQVTHQIWLLRNIFWWYLLPILIGMSAVVAQILWKFHRAGQGPLALTGWAAFYIIIYGGVYGGVFWLNQRVVRKCFEPRRQELAALLASLDK